MARDWPATCTSCARAAGPRLCPALSGWVCSTCCEEAPERGIACPAACPHCTRPAERSDSQAARLLADRHFLEQHLPLLGRIESALVRASSSDRGVRDRHAREAIELVIRGCRGGLFLPGPGAAGRLAGAVLDSLPPGQAAEAVIACCLFIRGSIEFHAEGTLEGRLYLEFVQEFFRG